MPGDRDLVTRRDLLRGTLGTAAALAIDKKERGRVLLRSTVTPDDLAADLRLLANER